VGCGYVAAAATRLTLEELIGVMTPQETRERSMWTVQLFDERVFMKADGHFVSSGMARVICYEKNRRPRLKFSVGCLSLLLRNSSKSMPQTHTKISQSAPDDNLPSMMGVRRSSTTCGK
jgi:hypothetical protein